MTSSDDPTPTRGEPTPPRWDDAPQPPAWDRPGAAAGYGPPPGYGPTPAHDPSGYGPPPGYDPSGYGTPYGGHGYAGPAQTESKAVVALVLALASWVLLPLIAAVAALVVGSRAARDIDLSAGRLTGRGLVTAARILSWINIALCVAGVVLVALVLVVIAAASGA